MNPPGGTCDPPGSGEGTVKYRVFTRTAAFIAITVMVALSLHSCAYFNTLYNARKIYNEAERIREQDGSERQLRDKYEEVVMKCASIITYYSDSRWVDDALFLMGKAFVRQGEYNKGIRKFIELITNFPESGYVPDATYWLALAHNGKGDNNVALSYVDRFLKDFPDHDLRYRLMFLAGDIHIELDDMEQALNFYGMVADEAGSREIIDEAILKSGDLFFGRKDWERAAASYERVLRKGLNRELRRDISLALGTCYTHTGKCGKALELFDSVLEETITVKNKPAPLLGRAESFLCMDSLETALELFGKVAKDYPNSDFSAEAYFRMGVIYHERLNSLKAAQEVFSKVSSESASSEHAPIALQKSITLKRLIELAETSGEGESVEQAAEKRFIAAEIQLFRLDEVEAALENYRAVIDSFPASSFAPRAAYAIAWIHHRKLGETEKAVEMYREVAARYPRSHQARGAVDEIGDLGAEEMKRRMSAFVDSALADTTGAAEAARKEAEGKAPADVQEMRERAKRETTYPLGKGGMGRASGADSLSVVSPSDTAAVRADTVTAPPDTAAAPDDSADVPADTSAVPADSVEARRRKGE